MTHEAKALSAGSTQAGGSARGLIRRALVTRAARKGAKGSGAPAAKLLGLLAFSLIALFVTAAPAQAAIQATTPILFDPSYTSVQVRAEADMNGFGEAIVQYSTDQNDWKTGFSVGDFSFQGGLRPVKGTITGLKGSTTYFVRVYAFGYFGGDAFSPEPQSLRYHSPRRPAGNHRHRQRLRGLLDLGHRLRQSQTPRKRRSRLRRHLPI